MQAIQNVRRCLDSFWAAGEHWKDKLRLSCAEVRNTDSTARPALPEPMLMLAK